MSFAVVFCEKRAELSSADRFQTREQLGHLKNLVIPPYLQKRYNAALLLRFEFSAVASMMLVAPSKKIPFLG